MNEPQSCYGPILGRYQVISELAKSRIGGLVMAIDVAEHRAVALRSFPVENRFDAESAAQLLEAGRWVKGLEDPAVMTPLEIGTQEGVLHAAYRYTISEPLRAVLRLAAFKGHAFPVGVALRIAYDVALGARAIEACGAPPHVGDSLCGALLPDSVLVGEDGRTRLCDAGIVTVLRREKATAEHADVLAYSAPEQMGSSGSVDGRTDVFTIGILLWEMLANRRLFALHDASKSHEFEVPPLESISRAAGDAIPPTVTAIVMRALALAPNLRHSGSTALLQAIESQCRDVMAPKEAVQAFMAELFGNIFESRARAIECATAEGSRESHSFPPASAAAQRDVGSRAAATKKQVAPDGDKERAFPVSRSIDNPADHDFKDSTSLEPSTPDTVREPNASVPAPSAASSKLPSLPPPPVLPRSVRPALVLGSKPPPMPVLPALPRQFELPGSELFATPGFPPVKRETSDELAAANDERAASTGNPVGPAIPAPPLVEPTPAQPEVAAAPNESESADEILAADLVEAASTPSVPRRRMITWSAWLSLVVCAFVGGVAARRCTRPETNKSPLRAEAATVSAVRDAGAALAASLPAVAAMDNNVQDAGSPSAPPASPSGVTDAEKPASSASTSAPAVAKPHATAKPPVRSAPKYNSKVSKVSGKTTRSR